MTRGTIVAFAPGVWGWPHFAGSPRYHLWTLAELGWRILYVEPPVRLRLMREHWSAPDGQPFHVVSPAMTLPFSVRHAAGQPGAELWRTATARQLAINARGALRTIGAKADVVWLGAPWHAPLRAAFANLPAVWHVYDELAESPLLAANQRAVAHAWEDQLLRAADLVLASSQPQLESRRSAKRIELLENAIPESFLGDDAPPPSGPNAEAFQALERPLFVYGGVADARLDPKLFAALAERLDKGTLLLLGLRDASLDPQLARLIETQPRVRLLGPIAHPDYRWYLRQADVLLLGHRRTPFTDAMFPEKLNEYLASGRPIVSIDLPEVVRVARETDDPDAVRVASSAEEWARQALEAVGDTDPQRAHARRELAARRTWGVQGRKLDGMLQELLAMRQ